MTRLSVGLIAAILLVSTATAKEEAAREKQYPVTATWKSVDVKDRANPPPFEPARREVEFSGAKPEGLGDLPEGLADPRYGRVEMLGRSVLLVLAKAGGESPSRDVLLLDSDGDGAFGEGERHALEVGRRGPVAQGVATDGVALASGGRSFRVVFVCAEGGEQPLVAQVIALWYLEATFRAGERDLAARFFDADADGKIGSEADGWVLAAADEVRRRPASQFAVTGLGGGIFLDGEVWRVAIGDGDAVTIRARPGTGLDPEDLAAQRERVEKLWFRIFDREREAFVKGRGLDTTRPQADKPIDWKYVTFDQGLALAKEQGKPLFVDLMAFWCVWCYRMDYYTYPDKEVAELLGGKFIPVKIIEEQDPAGDSDRVKGVLEAQGIPAMGVWDPEGNLLTKIPGWNPPAEFARLLLGSLEKLPK